jgi:hypothetical protein
LATLVFTQPVVALHESVVQGFASLQEIGVPAVQVPPWQVSAPLHRLPSRHGTPFGAGAVVQPVAGAQPSVVQGFESLQTSGVPAVQVPAWQVSGPLHWLPSVQDTPFATGVAVQPVAGLHVSVVHTFESLQTTGVPAVHTPAWHDSVPLQRFPSGHGVPLETTALPHTPAVQVSTVHGLLSLQLAAVLHDWHPEMGVFTQPLSALHESVVHALPSLQLGAVPGEQMPFWHDSLPLHTVESRQEVPLATFVY